VTANEKRRRFRDLAKHVPVKTGRQFEVEQTQLEFSFTPAARKPARRPPTKTTHKKETPSL
jgi:hypothetical protein